MGRLMIGFNKKWKGVAAVEMAMVLPVLLILCLGITELGRALYQYEGLVKAGRGAVRYLTQQDLNNQSAFEAASEVAKFLAVCGKKTCSTNDNDSTLIPGLTYKDYNKGKIKIEKYPNVDTGGGGVSLVSVVIGAGGSEVKFTSIFPWMIPSFNFSKITITMAYSTV